MNRYAVALGLDEPVDVAALRTDYAKGRRIGPVELEERRRGRIELRRMSKEAVVLADQTPHWLAQYVNELWLFRLEDAQ